MFALIPVQCKNATHAKADKTFWEERISKFFGPEGERYYWRRKCGGSIVMERETRIRAHSALISRGKESWHGNVKGRPLWGFKPRRSVIHSTFCTDHSAKQKMGWREARIGGRRLDKRLSQGKKWWWLALTEEVERSGWIGLYFGSKAS